MSTVPMRPTIDGTFPMQPTTDGTFPMQPTTGLNRETVDRELVDIKGYRRPLELVNKEINQILRKDLQYLRGLEGIGQNYGTNDTYNQTLLVWEFINGAGTYPKFDAEEIRNSRNTNGNGILDGGKRRKSRKSRKSSKSRKNRR